MAGGERAPELVYGLARIFFVKAGGMQSLFALYMPVPYTQGRLAISPIFRYSFFIWRGVNLAWAAEFCQAEPGIGEIMFDKVNPNLHFVENEKAIEALWRERDVFRKSMDMRKGGPCFTFYDGPPTANGKPHIGHVETRTIKDMIPRYRAMKGAYVPRKAGWDTHGLPVELEVEKLLGLDGKEQIEEYGLAPFIDKCKESVWKYKGMWEDFSATVGFWADMDNPYVTYHDDYIESVWWALRKIWDQGLLYKGFKIVPYCPRCGTPLSSHEVAQGYKDVKERSAIVRFPLVDEDAYILAWTTTPWTLPSNVALCVNPQEAYAKVKAADGKVYYLAQALLDAVLGGIPREEGQPAYTLLSACQGKDLEHREYKPLFGAAAKIAAQQGKKGFFVTCDGYVTLTDGTGVVHTAPAFGEDDARIGRLYDLPFVQLVDGKGEMTADTDYAGMFCKEADGAILKDLDAWGLLFAAPKFEHSYPHCWRCDTPLIYYARESWFVQMSAVKDRLIANNNTINWIPPSIGKGRFGDWLENIQDWSISRNRYWGTPLNVWECACGHTHAVGSRQELAELSGKPEYAQVELHRPYIDEVEFPCPKCGQSMRRVPEVIDCWFDSGAMPFAQHHYPFENKELFESQFPAQFISEAVDQTRGWFYSLLAISTLLFDKAPYENVLVMGHVQDENGQKMSKSKGNAVDPFEALETYGADAIRWYFYTSSAPWLPKRFSGKLVMEGQRKVMGTLWNTYAFFVLYANIDGFDPKAHRLEPEKLGVMDRWLLSRLYSTVASVDADLERYAIPEAGRAIAEFVDGMSNWYVRRSRERFWAKGMEQDKINAYMTLYTALVELCKLAAPMIPFITEAIYQNLVCKADAQAPESVHLCDYPQARPELTDTALEADMALLLDLVVLGRACRNEALIKNRQPVATLYVAGDQELPDFCVDILKEELNVKQVELTRDAGAFANYSFKPQLRTLGPKYGKRLGLIQKALAALEGNAAMAELEREGAIRLDLDGEEVRLAREDLLIETGRKEGFISACEGGHTVVLDIRLSQDLLEEGYVLELISKIQTMRKEADFEVTDHIRVGISGSVLLEELMEKHWAAIGGKVLGDAFLPGQALAASKDWDINGQLVCLSIERIR